MKPSIKSPCVAERHQNRPDARIAEFSGDVGGGLIEVRNHRTALGADITLVSLYHLDATVKVQCDAHQLCLSPNQWAALERIIEARKVKA